MKKIYIAAFAILCSVGVYAQATDETGNKEDLKVGDNSVELLFTPFRTDGATFNFSDFGFRYRHFWGQNALRVSLGVDFNSNKQGSKEVAEAKDSVNWIGTKNYYLDTRSTSLKFALGYERHFSISRRTAIYVGGELGYKGTIDNVKHWKQDDYTSGTLYEWDTETTYKNMENYTVTQPVTSTISIALLTGVDFHVYKGLYLGAELGLKYSGTFPSSLNETKRGTESSTVTRDGHTTVTTTTYSGSGSVTTITVDGKDATPERPTTHESHVTRTNLQSNFSFYVEPAIRIGWRF